MAEAASTGKASSARKAEVLRLWAVGLWIGLTLAVCIKTFVSPDDHSVYPKMAARAIAWWSGTPLYTDYEKLGRFAVLGNRLGGALWSVVSIGIYVGGGGRKLVRDMLPGAIERSLVGFFPGVRATLPVGVLLFVIWLMCLRPSIGRPADGRGSAA